MLSALIPPVGRKPAVPLAGQLAHESCVRPGPLVLGTAFLRFPTATPDRDRTVSRMLIPHYCGHRLYLHPISRGRRVMASGKYAPDIGAKVLRRHPLAVAGEEVVTGAQQTHATQMLLDIHGGDPLRFRIV